MSPNSSFFGVNRRVLLSALAVLPALSGPLLPMPARARARTGASGDPLPS